MIKQQPTCFVIALKEHKQSQRLLTDCINSATLHNWNIEIFWGTDGSTVSEESWSSEGIKMTTHGPMKDRPGVQGCFFSHWNLWNKCVELNEPIIILEHDAIITKPWPGIESFEYVTKLHTRYEDVNNHLTGKWGKSNHAYLISPINAKRIIDHTKLFEAQPADKMIGDKVVPWKYLDYTLVDRNANGGASTTVTVELGRY
jgi:GR25 family glycosyltransferase involved in LPS biosynthesis